MLVLEIAFHLERASVHSQHILSFIKHICRNLAAADVTSRFSGGMLFELVCLISIEGNKHQFTTHGLQINPHPQALDRLSELIFHFHRQRLN